MTDSRRPRADARRNYTRLLDEADAAFRERGVQSSLESIARRAGVAIGTLYGHFPTRRALVGALLRERHQALFELGDHLLAHPAPDALSTWVRAATAHAAGYSGLAAMLADGLDDEASELHTACLRMADTGERLVARAREAGALRPDATGADITALVTAAASLHEHLSAADSERLVTLTLDGLARDPGAVKDASPAPDGRTSGTGGRRTAATTA
ncbi:MULTISPECIES: TetR/AcrR family transcriptional regulator [Streptosporangium]|uniref:AcrR family transcriptional regulator n=1 Tax=Streptosporangium brasiliense TaxID=47480 RepID=A0ABT9RGN2_9ACTN|nr:TetR/AcrR family transcriptional regulator [Streptosporangium brasiliense]MDP9868427.1 AcrR family transcriptional regulator [Streptosporangium brasiliense]